MIEVYLMKMEDRLIYLYERYAWQEKINKMEYNTSQMKKKLTVKEGDINMSEGINIESVLISKFVEVVRTAIVEVVRTAIVEVVRMAIVEVVRTAINKKEYNTEMHEELIVKEDKVKEGNIIMLEDTNMREMVIFKFVEDRVEYSKTEMHEELTFREEEGTKKSEDYWSFRNKEKRHSLLSCPPRKIVEFVVSQCLHLASTAGCYSAPTSIALVGW
jgi:hypothetical protein